MVTLTYLEFCSNCPVLNELLDQGANKSVEFRDDCDGVCDVDIGVTLSVANNEKYDKSKIISCVFPTLKMLPYYIYSMSSGVIAECSPYLFLHTVSANLQCLQTNTFWKHEIINKENH